MHDTSSVKAAAAQRRWLRGALALSIFMATLTGFGQMPIFKRYYIADIPGLGWLGQFYVTHFLHYLFGALLLAISGYLAAEWALGASGGVRLTGWGKARSLILIGILLTGIALALKNFAGYLYSPAVIVGLDLIHLGLVMIWIVVSLFALISRKG